MSHLGFVQRRIPYPLRAARISLTLNPFGFWKPSFTHRKDLSEVARREGEIIWWVRFAWFQISYSRFM